MGSAQWLLAVAKWSVTYVTKQHFFRCKLQIQFSQNNRIHPKVFRFMKTAVNLLSDKLFLYRSNLFSLLRHLLHWLVFDQNAITSLSLSGVLRCCVFEIILKALYGGGALADTVCAINKLYYAKSSYQIKEYCSDCTPEHNFCHAEKSCRQLKHDVNTVILGKCANSHGPVAPLRVDRYQDYFVILTCVFITEWLYKK